MGISKQRAALKAKAQKKWEKYYASRESEAPRVNNPGSTVSPRSLEALDSIGNTLPLLLSYCSVPFVRLLLFQ